MYETDPTAHMEDREETANCLDRSDRGEALKAY